jgi:hypothetical protein
MSDDAGYFANQENINYWIRLATVRDREFVFSNG